jgi:hypothetical protein
MLGVLLFLGGQSVHGAGSGIRKQGSLTQVGGHLVAQPADGGRFLIGDIDVLAVIAVCFSVLHHQLAYHSYLRRLSRHETLLLWPDSTLLKAKSVI